MSRPLLRDLLCPQFDIGFEVTQSLIDHPLSWPFRRPIDEERDGAPDYSRIVKNPMDLGTVLRKLQDSLCGSVCKWQQDIDLIWDNCMTYNGKESMFKPMMKELQRVYKKAVRVFHRRV
jgi:bromodomain-containing protein 2